MYLPSRWRPTDPGYLFAQARVQATGKLSSFAKGSSPLSPFARPSSSPHQAAIDCSASEREETARAFIPTPCASPRAFPHALHGEARDPKREFKRTSSLPGTISIVRVISIIRDPFFSQKETESGKRLLNCN